MKVVVRCLLLVGLAGVTACVSPLRHIKATTSSGVKYVGSPPAAAGPPVETELSNGELLVAGYVPIGYIEATAKVDADSVGPLRFGAAMQRGELFKFIERNLPADGELRLKGRVCEARGSALQPGGGGAVDVAFGAMDVGLVAAGGGACTRWSTIDQTTWFPMMMSRASVWERRPELDLSTVVAYRALRSALVEERHAGALAQLGDRFYAIARFREDGVALGGLINAGYPATDEQRASLVPVLSAALAAGDAAAVSNLVAAGIVPPAGALHQALAQGDRKTVAALAKVERCRDARDKDGRTALQAAADLGDLGAVLALIAAGVDPNARDDDGQTALTFAAKAGRSAVLRLLLARGATPAKSSAAVAALVERCACTVADELIRAGGRGPGCDDERRGRATGATRALLAEMERIAKNQAERFTAQLPADAFAGCVDLEAKIDGVGLMSAVTTAGRVDWLLQLRERGVDLEVTDGATATLLVYAAAGARDPSALEVALTNGLDPNAGEVPLLLVAARLTAGFVGLPAEQAARGRKAVREVLEVLLAGGADPNLRSGGQTAREAIVRDPRAVELLERYGAKP